MCQKMLQHFLTQLFIQFFFKKIKNINTIRPKKRFAPWLKANKIKDLEYVKEYYGYNDEKAKSALELLSDEQITTIKDSLNKGGRK